MCWVSGVSPHHLSPPHSLFAHSLLPPFSLSGIKTAGGAASSIIISIDNICSGRGCTSTARKRIRPAVCVFVIDRRLHHPLSYPLFSRHFFYCTLHPSPLPTLSGFPLPRLCLMEGAWKTHTNLPFVSLPHFLA